MMIESEAHRSKVSRRLQDETAQEICDFIYLPRLADFARGFPYLTAINQAHILMLDAQALIPSDAAKTLAEALLQMEENGPSAIALDPQREDAYFNYEAHLIGKVGLDIGGRAHTARSRNDILATMDRMRCRDLVIALLDALAELRQTAAEQAARYVDVVMPGYTHLQPAQPMTYGFYLAGVAEALERDAERLAGAYGRVDRCPLGAGAFAGTPYGIDRSETARLLGFPAVVDSTLDAVASRDFIFEVLGSLSILAATWSRIAQDYFLWSTDEFRFIEFPDSVAGTSSIMPQKKNPIVLEFLKGKAGHIIGHYAGAVSILRATNFTHSGDANRESISFFWGAADDCLTSLKLLRLIIRTASPRREVMLKRARENFSSATDLADAIVMKSGLSFRQAHHIVGAVVRDALDHDLTADRISLDMVQRACRDQMGREIALSEEDVHASLDPRISVASRRDGGPAEEGVRMVLGKVQAKLDADRQDNRRRREVIDAACRDRRRLMEELAG
ncbi:argininosuccinate lyase [Azorhizobium caulinodans ORS 571]|uniref:Argininosuccinate lyase n=2 Tax=Azorhizobium caulinodans TaxID=7 RepID=A8IK84_AZOC5|nr:argininosuccinate lyase [Azorhizobium caulinodans ORS 571]